MARTDIFRFIECRAFGRRRVRLRAAALFEVVVALSILLVAMMIVGATFRNGSYHVELAERMNQANTLTERLLVELDMGLLPIMQPVDADTPTAGANRSQELTGWFEEEAPPGMSWKIEVAPDLNVEGVLKVGVHIFLGDPDASEGRRNQRLLTTYVFRAEPRNINLMNDFGFTEEQMSMLTDAVPGGAALFDPTNFNPRDIAGLDLDTLGELFPILLAAFGGGMGEGQLNALMQAAQSGDMSALNNLARQLGAAPSGQQGGDGAAPNPGASGPSGRRPAAGGSR